MAKSVTLKNSNGDTLYPVTDASLINGSLQASQIPANAITTDRISDGAVTADKIADGAVDASKIVGGEGLATLAAGGLVELIGTPPPVYGQGSWAWKFADGRLINFQRYKLCVNATNMTQWGGVYSKDAVMNPVDYAVPFTGVPVVSVTSAPQPGTVGNHWLATDTGKGTSSSTRPPAYQPVRGSSGSVQNIYLDIIAYGFWK